jgi:hypothetical protein
MWGIGSRAKVMLKKIGTRGILNSCRVGAYTVKITQVAIKFDFDIFIGNTDLLTFPSFLILYFQSFSNKIILCILCLSIPFFDTFISEECSQGPL